MDPTVDEITAEPASDPTYREGVSVWVWDDRGRFAFPRIGIEAVGATWTESFNAAVCLAWPDGRVLRVNEPQPPSADRRAITAGPLRFECVEPFEHWRVTFEGDIGVDLDVRSAAPPWFQGTHDPEGSHVAGEHRFEQLCTVTGSLTVDGTTTPFTGGGLRIHRKGGARNDHTAFPGHNWQSARFPGGRAFGFIHYRPQPDGTPTYREGWLLDGGQVVPARVEGTPWMTDTRPSGEDVSFTMQTPSGAVRIAGETFVSSFRAPRADTGFPLLHSGIARYRWDDEEAFGMIERSSPDVTLD